MKRFLRTLGCLLCGALVCSCLVSCFMSVGGHPEQAGRCYLVVGMDEAADNTDVMFLCKLDTELEQLSMLQLPRDTYFSYGTSQDKLNQVYAKLRAEGKGETEALAVLSQQLSEALGVRIDGYFAFTTKAFRGTVDALGGVTVTLPTELLIPGTEGEEPLALSAGEHWLDGKAAERFVRHRSSYLMGDLGRMDAQKLFLSAVLRTLREQISPYRLLSFIPALYGEIKTDVSLGELTLLLPRLLDMEEPEAKYATLPGEPTEHHGISYYVLNRKSAVRVLEELVGLIGEFDPNVRFMHAERENFYNIYTDPHGAYRIYGEEDLSGLHVPEKTRP